MEKHLYSAVVILLVALVALIRPVHSNAAGAGPTACTGSAMVPGHGGSPQSGSSPYGIQLSASEYEAGGSISVTLIGSASFKGFLILALPETDATGSAVGSFSGGGGNRQDRCSGGATHTSAFSGASPSLDTVELTWNAPNTDAGNIIFYATFVKEFSEYWVKIPSETVTFVNAPTAPTTTTSTSTTTLSTTLSASPTNPVSSSTGTTASMPSITSPTASPPASSSGPTSPGSDMTSTGSSVRDGQTTSNAITWKSSLVIVLYDLLLIMLLKN